MDISFTKMQSCGNDFIILDYLEKNAEFSNDKSSASAISSLPTMRRFGIGSDGVVALYNDKSADMYIKVLLPDGKNEKLCLNAVLCASKYIYEKGYIFKDELKIKTDYGTSNVTLFINKGKITSCEIETPSVDFNAHFSSFPKEKGVRHGRLHTQGGTFWFGCAYFGGEYTCIFCDDISSAEIKKSAHRLLSNASFKDGSDIILANIVTPSHIMVRTFKRGCGEMLSCATASCVSLALAVKKGLCQSDTYVLLENTGGTFHIKCDKNFKMYLIGESEIVYDGKYQEE